jgi:opacity protein-like surface antigen
MKKIILAVAVAAVATMAVVASASADVPRYQPTATLVVTLTDAQPGNHHTFTITWTNPCGADGMFTGTGHGSPEAGGANESITGTLVGDHLTFTATYETFIPGYTWSYDGPLSGAALGNQAAGYHATASVTTINSVKNHGDYVSSQGGGSDAAHSCIGMPTH